MSDLASAQDIISQALRFSGEISDVPPADTVSEYRTRALDYLNRIHKALVAGGNEFDVEMAEPFSWAVADQPGVLVLQPAIQAFASLAQGATSGTFSAIPVDSFGNQVSVQGRYIKFNNFSDIYRITAHTLGQTAFTVDLAYQNTSQVVGTCTMYQLDYTLTQTAGIMRLVGPLRLFQIQSKTYDGEVVGSDMAAMRREFPIAFLQTRYPDRFCIKSQANNAFVIQINTNPLDYARAEYDYIPYPTPLTDSTSSIPIVPLEHRMTLAYGVAHYICTDKNDTRADKYKADTAAGMVSIVKAQKKLRVDLNRERGRLVPRQDLLKRRSVPWWWGRW